MTGTSATFTLLPLEKLRPHEHVDPEEVAKLAERLELDGVLQAPVAVDAATRVVLDGHHRLAALERLGCTLVPCHVVDYLDPTIRVTRWEDGRPMDKTELVRRAFDGDLYPIKTSRHTTLRRLPHHPTPVERLRQEAPA